MKTTLFFSVLFTALFLFPFEQTSAQEESPYDQGTVWSMTFIKTAANHGDDYMKDLAKTWVASMEEAKQEGLIVSYKILRGLAANDDDFNLVLMMENKSMGDFDPNKDRDAKWAAVNKKVKEKMGDQEFDKAVANYDVIREMKGTKVMRELNIKK